MQALFLAMALYPEVQKKAQVEIDTVVGPNRLPDFDDRPFLPYINAIVKESMRWHLVGPLGTPFFLSSRLLYIILTGFEAIPHMASNDDEYDGYHIPKGTVLIGSTWPVHERLILLFILAYFCLGPCCMTLNILTIPWNISLNGF